jgi:DNA-binding response OmpR family regulator
MMSYKQAGPDMNRRSTILIVDDDPAGRRAIEAPLLNDAYDLVLAQDGPEALAAAHELRPDLILLDVMMPGMDGFEVCRRLRADPVLAEVPIVLVTALDDRSSKLQGLAAGADDFLPKPFDRAELRARVQTITRLNRYRSLYAERMQFRWIIDTASEGYLLLDEEDHILYLNQPAARLLNLEGSRPVGKPQDTQSESFINAVRRQYQCEPPHLWHNWPQVDALESDARFLVRPATNQALAVWLSVEILTVPPGTAAAYLVRLRDVTQQVTEMRDLASFRLAVQHKLRTPVAHMAMSATLLALAEVPEGLPPAAAEYASFVQTAAEQLGRQIDDLLTYSNPVPEPGHAPNAVLAEVEAIARRLAADRALPNFTWEALTPADHRVVPLGARAIEIILAELFENATKFHPSHAPGVALTLHAKGEESVVLRCEDDGVALAPTQIDMIWKPYYQAEAGFSGNMPGAGLGLPLIASLVVGAGGRVRCYNRHPGPGFGVELILPLWAQSGHFSGAQIATANR